MQMGTGEPVGKECLAAAGRGQLYTADDFDVDAHVAPGEALGRLYACEHLHTRLLLVLGHTHCGAIKAALEGESGPVAPLTERIAAAIGDERDPYEASVRNVEAAMSDLRAMPELAALERTSSLVICGAIYHTHCGVVDFL